MFTGLIEEIGVVKDIQTRQGALQFAIRAHEILTDLTVDDSIAINGVCLTTIKITDSTFEVEAVEETLRKTTLGAIRKGTRLNLERSLCFSDRLAGHLVQGHVDDVGQVTSVQPQKGGRLLTITIPGNLKKYVISEGSIAIDGVSLTVARISKNAITIALIPHTLEKTTLAELRVGDKVNIEVDLIGKYIENLMVESGQSKLSKEWLQKMGYN